MKGKPESNDPVFYTSNVVDDLTYSTQESENGY